MLSFMSWMCHSNCYIDFNCDYTWFWDVIPCNWRTYIYLILNISDTGKSNLDHCVLPPPPTCWILCCLLSLNRVRGWHLLERGMPTQRRNVFPVSYNKDYLLSVLACKSWMIQITLTISIIWEKFWILLLNVLQSNFRKILCYPARVLPTWSGH